MTLIEKSDTYLDSPSTSESGDLLLDAWRVCLAQTLHEQKQAWERHTELMLAKQQAIICQLEAKIAGLEARIQSRLGELQDGPQGEPGPQGPEGPQGTEGTTGARGEPGERGLPGEVGIRGDRGERGSLGPVGLRGPRGEKGLRGERGERGWRGEKGNNGQNGARGERGEPGSIGLQGPIGEKGERGESGQTGKDGQNGEKGEKGETGERGDPGEKGERGETGACGPQGSEGPLGPRGESGLPGPMGKIGPQGGSGPAGPQGEKGDPGLLPVVRVWSAEEITYRGNVVFHDGSTYQAQKDTAQAPPHRDWLPLALSGRNAVSPCVRGTYDLAQSYDALNIVALNGGAFIARHDNPGECPGDGWQLIASKGKAGQPGPKGDRGERGERGPIGLGVIRGEVGEDLTLKLFLSDGAEITVPCRDLFRQYHEEVYGGHQR